MSQIGNNLSRVTNLQTSDSLLSSIRNTQRELLDIQKAITTGFAVTRPSQAPEKTAAIQIIRQQLHARSQYNQNLEHAEALLNFADATLGDVTDIAHLARSVAASQVNFTANADTRDNQSVVIDANIRTLIDLANRQLQGISLFGGNAGPKPGDKVFTDFLGGVRYTGSLDANLQGDFGLSEPLDFNANGQVAFGSLSSRVKSVVDLDPLAVADVNIKDIAGAQGLGVRQGSVTLNVDGTPVTVDLNGIDTLDDAVIRINDAINAIDPTAGSLAIAGAGYALTANVAHTITISDILAGQTAADLGINLTATAATVTGGDLGVKLTMQTRLADLGVVVDFASGLQITQGQQTKVANFAAATTVEDLKNEIDRLQLGLRLEINAAGDSLDLISEVSGLELAIGENAGTTASDLGVRSFSVNTQLANFRHGLGVIAVTGQDDFAIELHNAATFNVNLDGLATVNQVITAITTAATVAGLTVGALGAGGTDFNIGLAATGNGLVFEDNTAGAADFRVRQLGESLAAVHLGVYQNAGAAATINGADNAMVRVEGLFTHLINLRDSLVKNDTLGITLAGGGLERDVETVARVQADVGVRSQRVTQSKERSLDMEVTEREMLSNLRDADLTEVISRFSQLQQQLQASLQTGATGFGLSLLDFLG